MPAEFSQMMSQALELVLVLSLAPLGAAWLTGTVGSAVAIRVSAPDPVVVSVPKAIVVWVTVLACGPWLAEQTLEFTRAVMAVAFG